MADEFYEDINNTKVMDGVLPPYQDPDSWEFFAFVVDGEVANIFPVYKNDHSQGMIAAFSSDPKVIKLKDDEKNNVGVGMILDSHTNRFRAPYSELQ